MVVSLSCDQFSGSDTRLLISGGDREENICSDTKINRYVTRAVVECSVGAGGAAAACQPGKERI